MKAFIKTSDKFVARNYYLSHWVIIGALNLRKNLDAGGF